MFNLKNILILILRNAIYSFIAVTIAVVAIVFLSNNIKNISESIALSRRLETALGKRAEIIEILKRDAQIIGTNDVEINNAFVSSDNILGFINALDNLAQKKSVAQVYRFQTPTISTISAAFPISTILYSNSLATDLSNFVDYLKEFEKLPYFTKIDGLSIASQDKLGWLGISTISFNATLYTKGTQ